MTRTAWLLLPTAVLACSASPSPTHEPRATNAAPSRAVIAAPSERSTPATPTGSEDAGAPVERGAAAGTERADAGPGATARRPVIYSTGRVTWIYEKASTDSRKLGILSVGVGVALRDPERRDPSNRCGGGFYAVEPTGFVCSTQQATLDDNHPVVKALSEVRLPADATYPYRYGLSLGAPMYNKLPDRKTHDVVMMRYPNMGKRLGDWAKSFLDMDTGSPIEADGEVPSFLRDGQASPNSTSGFVRRSIPHASLISYTRAFEHEGRVWVIAEDLSIVPADRIVPYRRTEFRGVVLGAEQRLPLAWACRGQRRKFRKEAGGAMVATGESWPARALVPLTGATELVRREKYHEAIDSSWIAGAEACRATVAERLPEGIGERDKWMYLSMGQNTLTAYRGREPLFATLHSPGRGGAHRGKGDVRSYTTPLGSFFINWKERWATLSPDPGAPTSFWISDVPGVQYFEQPYALHGAYWHENFGQPMSAGCPNLSPHDAVWLLDFSEPPLPAGWQAIGPSRGQTGTMVVVGP